MPTTHATAAVVTLTETGALIPHEVPTPPGLLKAADTYQQIGIKYPHRATYHSYAELLHGALLEGDPTVSLYVPHPFSLRIGRRLYIPDCYLLCAGRRIVRELKPRADFDDALQRSVTAFLADQGIRFEVVAYETLLAREQEAQNWLHILRSLVVGRWLETTSEEQALLDQLTPDVGTPIDALLDPTDRVCGWHRELALYRLLHRGAVASAALAERALDFTTEVRRCK